MQRLRYTYFGCGLVEVGVVWSKWVWLPSTNGYLNVKIYIVMHLCFQTNGTCETDLRWCLNRLLYVYNSWSSPSLTPVVLLWGYYHKNFVSTCTCIIIHVASISRQCVFIPIIRITRTSYQDLGSLVLCLLIS